MPLPSRSARLVLDTLLPAQGHPGLPQGLEAAAFDAFWLDLERTALPAWRWSFHAAAFTATWVAPLLIGRLPPLGLHDRATREHALAALSHSRFALLRRMLGMLKTVASFCYGADPGVRAAIGYPLQPDSALRSKAQR